MVDSQHSNPLTPFTEYGIPIGNLWRMLLYAWNEVPLHALRGWAMETVDVEHAPTLDSLLASILIALMQQRLRIGLGHDYVEQTQKLAGVHGRIQFAPSLKQRTLDRGQLICTFHGYSANSTKNQIIRSTLARLIQVGRFGPETATVRETHPLRKLRRLVRDLDGIDFIELTPELTRRQLLQRHDHDYRLMLAVCDLIVQRQLPAESGSRTAVVPALDRERLVLYNIYERFVANFYHRHLTDWEVSAQKRLEWHASEASEHLPLMIPDLVLRETRQGSNRLLVLDTKFTAGPLVENRWGKPIYDSAHLYQLYAYLKSQENVSETHRTAVGILLYPALQQMPSEKIQLQDHVIRIETVNLAAPWQEVERQLLELVERSP